jgi:two-component system, NtrC family, response regulator HydG
MAKILLSWMAYENDFVKGSGSVNDSGPTCTIHKHFYDREGYDFHLLLTSRRDVLEDTRLQHLVAYLNKTYKQHKIHTFGMDIRDVIDLPEINSKVSRLLLSYKKYEIDICVSPGTPTMQTVWFLAHESLGLKTKLYHLRRPEHSKSKVPEKFVVDIERSSINSSLIIRQNSLEAPAEEPPLFKAKALEAVYERAKRVASVDNLGVLILGETGTGKELLAKYIKRKSIRHEKPFVPLNCASMTESLLEPRLFGYIKGSHSTAHTDRTGIFEDADGGTVFLDEIGDISLYMQQTLLRVLQEKEIQRIGESKVRKVDVRIIAATNMDLADLCAQKKFRWDLYYRLAVSVLRIPSLVEYSAKDKENLFQYLWENSMEKLNKKGIKLPVKIKKRILDYPFPGNIREMENIIDSILAEAENEITDDNLPERIIKPGGEHSLLLKDAERRHILMVYRLCGENLKRASETLGISFNTLKSKLRGYASGSKAG